jgi:hypothetical protein
MGCWNETCALSNFPISPGEKVVFLLLTQNPYDSQAGRSGCNLDDFFFIRSVPLYGTYDDYGRVSLDDDQDSIIELIRDGFSIDLIPREAAGPYDDRVHMDDWTFDNLQSWLHDGLVRVDQNALSRLSSPNSAEYQAIKPGAVYKIIIRQDAWDAFIKLAVQDYRGEYTYETFKSGADKVLERMKTVIDSPPEDKAPRRRSLRSIIRFDLGDDNIFIVAHWPVYFSTI